MKKQRWVVSILALLVVLAAVACGDDDETVSSETTAEPSAGVDDDAFPVTVTATNGSVTIPTRPEAIVSLSPSGTEMLFAVGAGDQVIAVDDYSYFPEEAPVTELSSYQPNVEAIADYEPDLVLLSNDPGDVADALDKLGIPVLVLTSAKDLDETFSQIETVGAATGHIGGAAELVAQMQADIDEIVAGLPEELTERTYFHELDSNLYTVTSDTFIGQVYGLLGLSSIADAADGAAASGGYPQLSAEFVIEADPDFIFLADAQCCDQSPETVAARPGWDSLTAVAQNRVIQVDEDTASRWGPRIVDHLRLVADALADELVDN